MPYKHLECCSDNELRTFLFKVFGLLTCQEALTALCNMMAMYDDREDGWKKYIQDAAEYHICVLPLVFIVFILSIYMVVFKGSDRRYPGNFRWAIMIMSTFSFMMSYWCSYTKYKILATELSLMVLSVPIAMIGYIWCAPEPFEFSDPIPIINGLILIQAIPMGLIFWDIKNTLAAVGLAFGYSLYIIIDLMLITKQMTSSIYECNYTDQYILAFVGLYLDCIGIFRYIYEMLKDVNFRDICKKRRKSKNSDSDSDSSSSRGGF